VKDVLLPDTDVAPDSDVPSVIKDAITHTDVAPEDYLADVFFSTFGNWGACGSYKEVKNINKSVFRLEVSNLIAKLVAVNPRQKTFTKDAKTKSDGTHYYVDKKLLYQYLLENALFEED